ncbi:hypothetical protein VNI00_000626 [Paramarasmius palmivorus]|uniref:Peptide hydrolase n=1 Tax=Paramarasmius palmivorus TaxID=297713 RepID=A0AAW0E8C2_9AGAR
MGLVRAIFGFHTIPVSTVLVLIYVAVWLSTYITDQIGPVPAKLPTDINLTQAYLDLERLTLRPHPYNSHANDDVRNFILDTITERNPGIDIVYDTNSTGTWVGATVVGTPATASYFEGNNILVRIPGTSEQSTPGVLFSAHWDSVSTAPGATDDGIGISTLIQLIHFFHKHPPKRTVIFNINNGEEDGLHGAHAFLLHPWAAEVKDFINLEGAAAGGPVLAFRATGESVMRAYRKGGNGNVHANVLSADAFQRGLVRSGTDYQVYTDNNRMRGVDVAFTRGRARYHTKYDAVPWTEGRDRAVWGMLDAAFTTGVALADDVAMGKAPIAERKGVWFDLFGSALVLFSLDSLFVFNIVALVVGPIVLLLLLALQVSVSRKRTRNGHWLVFGSTPMARALWTSAKYWFALVVVAAVQVGWVAGWVRFNPFMVHTYPYTILVSSFTLSFLVFTLVVNMPLPAKLAGNTQHLSPSPLPLLLHTYLLTYVLLIVSTVGISKLGIAGTYFITAWNALVWFGCVFGVIFGKGGLVFSGKQTFVVSSDEDANEDGQDSGDESRTAGGSHDEDRREQVAEYATERTPLLSGSDSSTDAVPKSIEPHTEAHAADEQTTYTWLPLMFIVLPLPLILLSQITTILIGALPQTLADGNSALSIYVLLALVAGVSGLFGWPFVVCGSSSPERKGILLGGLHRYVVFVLIVVFVITTLPGWLAGGFFYGKIADRSLARWTETHGLYPPFGTESPLKVFFQQTVQIIPPVTGDDDPEFNTITSLTGSAEFLEPWIIPRIPSAAAGAPNCSFGGVDARKTGLIKCEWPSGEDMVPEPGLSRNDIDKDEDDEDGGHWDWNASPNPWFTANFRNQIFNVTSAPHTVHPVQGASIAIRRNNTRNCRVYFDRPVASYRVRDSTHGAATSWDTQKGYEVPDAGLNEVRLWSRSWEKTFILDVIWKEQDQGTHSKTSGRVACEWAEYESGMAGLGSTNSTLKAKIPAFEEVLSFLPRWAVVSKLTDGLVEVRQDFEVWRI